MTPAAPRPAVDPARIEHLADAAWPAAEQVPLHPWKLRATHGVTRRANSVFTAGGPDLPADVLADLVEIAEGFYARRALSAAFQVSAGTGARGLDDFLARRGYRLNAPSEVWTLDVAPRAPRAPPPRDIARAAEPDDGWFDCAFDEPPDRRRVHEQIVRRVPRPRTFLSARAADGPVIGCGMGVSAAGHTGVFAMATRPDFRRRGIAAAVLHDLCEWAAKLGDERVYLQVMGDNEPAKALYARAGFTFAYAYHYRIL